jgi:hypothetical protein
MWFPGPAPVRPPDRALARSRIPTRSRALTGLRTRDGAHPRGRVHPAARAHPRARALPGARALASTGVVTEAARRPSLVQRDLVVCRPGPVRRPRFPATRVPVPAPDATRALGNGRRRAGLVARSSRGPAARAGTPDRTEALIPGLVQIAGAADSTGTAPRTCAGRGLAGTTPCTGTAPRTCAGRGLAGTARRARAACRPGTARITRLAAITGAVCAVRATRLTGLAELAGVPFPGTRTGTGTGTGTGGRTRARGRSRTAGPARAVRCSGAARCR